MKEEDTMEFGDVPNWLVWALLIAVIVQGFSMALLVYLMFRRSREAKKTELVPEEPPEENLEEEL